MGPVELFGDVGAHVAIALLDCFCRFKTLENYNVKQDN